MSLGLYIYISNIYVSRFPCFYIYIYIYIKPFIPSLSLYPYLRMSFSLYTSSFI